MEGLIRKNEAEVQNGVNGVSGTSGPAVRSARITLGV